MITVEIRKPTGLRDWDVLTSVHVDDDDEVTISGDDSLVADLRVPTAQGFITREEDPQQWARNLGSSFRAGYLQAVVVADSGAPA